MASRPPPAAPLSSLTCDPKLLEAPIRANSLDLMTRDVQVAEFDERATMRAGNRFLFPAPSTERAIMSFEDWECVFKADGYKGTAAGLSLLKGLTSDLLKFAHAANDELATLVKSFPANLSIDDNANVLRVADPN